MSGLVQGEGFNITRIGMGMASGALIGAGIDITIASVGAGATIGAGLIGAGLGGVSGGGLFSSETSWRGFGVGAAIGGVSGLAGGGAGFMVGRGLGTSLVGMAGTGMVSGAAANAASQGMGLALGTQSEWSWRQLGWSALGGAAGGFAGGLFTRGLINPATSKIYSNPTLANRAQFFGRHAVGGGIGGFLGDAADQLGGIVAGTQSRWDWGRSFHGAAMGAAMSLPSSAAMWKYHRTCFAAGTPLLWEHGSKPIEQFRVGDRLWSRDEFNPFGSLELKVIEEVFVNTGRLLHLHIGGRIIKTTVEHPFYVQSRGWIAAAELHVGDLLSSHDGQWVAVEEVYDTGEYETVYNLRVADFHTYFVGGSDWGFSVWAHNAYDVQQAANARHQRWANDQAAIEGTLARLGQRALRGGGDWRAAEARFQRYAALVESRLTRTGSRFAVEVEPAAFRGSGGRRAESWTQPDRDNPGMREWMSVRGSRRLDIGLIDTTQLDPVGNPYRVVAGFDITTNPYKPSIGAYYQEAFGRIPIYDIRASGITVHL